MKTPPSPHFTPIDLRQSFNVHRADLPDILRTPKPFSDTYGEQVMHGMPFALGEESSSEANVLLLDSDEISIAVDGLHAGYLLFLHVAENRSTNYQTGFADHEIDGNELGQTVSTYTIEYADGSRHETPILRRFAIQQSRVQWGAAAFAAIPALEPTVMPTASEDLQVNGATSLAYGRAETRHSSGRDRSGEHLWLYALPNPNPDVPISRIVCTPGEERSAIYAVTAAPQWPTIRCDPAPGASCAWICPKALRSMPSANWRTWPSIWAR